MPSGQTISLYSRPSAGYSELKDPGHNGLHVLIPDIYLHLLKLQLISLKVRVTICHICGILSLIMRFFCQESEARSCGLHAAVDEAGQG